MFNERVLRFYILLCLKMVDGGVVYKDNSITYIDSISTSGDVDIMYPLDVTEGGHYESVEISFNVSYEGNLCNKCKQEKNEESCCPRMWIYTWDLPPKEEFLNWTCDKKVSNFTDRPDFNNWNLLLSAASPGCSRDKSTGIITCIRTNDKRIAFSAAISKLYTISFGSCDSDAGVHLNYSVTFTNITDGTYSCEDLRPKLEPICALGPGLYPDNKVLMPGALGYPSQVAAELALTSAAQSFVNNFFLCYQYPMAFSCLSALPACRNGRRYFPCRQMCREAKIGCSQMLEKEGVRFTCDNFIESYDQELCYYKPVVCNDTVKYGRLNHSGTGVLSRATVECSPGYWLQGSHTVDCQANGTWNGTFECMPDTGIDMIVSASLSGITAAVVFIVVLFLIRRKYLKQKKIKPTQNYICNGGLLYDIYVSYSALDGNFVENDLLNYLENSDENSFKLCLHERDFLPGEFIQENILKAIEKSAICLVILSKNYINSPWCLHEFSIAYSRVIQERLPSCALLVVLLEPICKDQLPDTIRAYYLTCTYIDRKHERFWKKLREVLDLSKQKLCNTDQQEPKTVSNCPHFA